MACPIRTLSVKKQGEVPLSLQGGSGGIPRPFEGGIGGPGGHRGEVGIPPAPLAGGANLQKKGLVAISESKFFFASGALLQRKKSFCTPQKSDSPLSVAPRSQRKIISHPPKRFFSFPLSPRFKATPIFTFFFPQKNKSWACCRKQFLRHAPFANKSREERRHSIKKQPAKAKKRIRS